MLNYLLDAFWAALILVVANAPLAVYRFFCGARSSKADAATEKLSAAEEEERRVHRKRRRNALLWGGFVPVGGFVIAALVGLTRVHADVSADRFLAGLVLYTAVLVVIFAGAQVIAELEPKHHLSRYIDLAGKMGVLVTAAITVGMLLTENGIDLVAGLGSG